MGQREQINGKGKRGMRLQIRRLNIICKAIQERSRTKDELLELFERTLPYHYSPSTLEKDFQILKREFDAPLTGFRLGTKHYYQLPLEFNFIDSLTAWANEGYQTTD